MTNEEYHKHDESNRLIAEFEGLETVQRHPRTQEWTQARFDYHNSWDSLMAVVDKIEEKHLIHVVGNICFILITGHDKIRTEGSNKLEAVYQCVVRFIQWYNENKKP